MEIIGEVIHGGKILVRERVGDEGMYRYNPASVRATREAMLVEAARKAFPWAPQSLRAVHGQDGRDYHHYLTVTLIVPALARAKAVRERLADAENTRCGCGSHGSWDRSVSGTSHDVACVWAGCTNCRGQALGRPILAADLAWYESRGQAALR